MMKFPKQKDVVVVDAEPHSGREYEGHSKKKWKCTKTYGCNEFVGVFACNRNDFSNAYYDS